MQNIGTDGIIDRVTQSQHFQTINESTHVNVGPNVNGHVNEDTRSQLSEPPNGSTQVNLYFQVSIAFKILYFIFELTVTTSSYKKRKCYLSLVDDKMEQ